MVYLCVYISFLWGFNMWNVVDRCNLYNVLSGVLLYCCMDKYSKIDS